MVERVFLLAKEKKGEPFVSLDLLLATSAAPASTQNLASQPVAASQLVMSRTDRRLAFTGDPTWNLEVQTLGSDGLEFETVTGRAHRQNSDRHCACTRAPLPPDRYSIGPVEALGPHDQSELGPVWTGIEQGFPTGLDHLGIQLDTSYQPQYQERHTGLRGPDSQR